MIKPQHFEPGQTVAWSTKERCEEIVAFWKSQRTSGASPTYRIYPAAECAETMASNPPAWAHVIEVRS